MDIAGHRRAWPRRQESRRSAPAKRRARASELTPLIQSLIERGWIGEKAGQGFYQRSKTRRRRFRDSHARSRDAHLPSETVCHGCRHSRPLDRSTMWASGSETLFLGSDKVGAFLRDHTGADAALLRAQMAPVIAHSIDDVDRAMRWGFGWELGPFEIWDADRRSTGDRRGGQSPRLPLVEEVLRTGRNRFRDDGLRRAGAGSAASEIGEDAGSSADRQRAGRAWSTSTTACWPSSFTRR